MITGCFNLLVVDWSKLSKVLLSMKGLSPLFIFLQLNIVENRIEYFLISEGIEGGC